MHKLDQLTCTCVHGATEFNNNIAETIWGLLSQLLKGCNEVIGCNGRRVISDPLCTCRLVCSHSWHFV